MHFGHVIQSAHVLAVHMFCTCNYSVYQMSAAMERKKETHKCYSVAFKLKVVEFRSVTMIALDINSISETLFTDSVYEFTGCPADHGKKLGIN